MKLLHACYPTITNLYDFPFISASLEGLLDLKMEKECIFPKGVREVGRRRRSGAVRHLRAIHSSNICIVTSFRMEPSRPQAWAPLAKLMDDSKWNCKIGSIFACNSSKY